MAPSRKASVQKDGRAAARTPPATPRNPRQPRRRSASPPSQPIPLRFRDEPPARSTRSAFAAPSIVRTMPTATQRVPVDCPFLRCRASTLHQHLPQLQYFNPHPGRAIHYHGYGSSNSDTSSRPSLVVTLRTARQDNGDSLDAPETAGNDEMAEVELESEAQALEAGDVETAAQEPENNTAQSESPSEERNESREAAMTMDSPAVDDMIPDESTSLPLQAPMTPPPSSPIAAETPLSAQESTTSPGQDDEQHSTAPPPTLIEFGDWLPTQSPEETAANPSTPHVLTYDELIRPFLAPHLPPAPGMEGITQMLQEFRSLTDRSYRPTGMEDMRAPATEYMRQCEEELSRDIDWESWMWQ